MADLTDPTTLTDEELEKIISGENLEDPEENQDQDDTADEDTNDDKSEDADEEESDDSNKDEDGADDTSDTDESKKDDKKDDKPSPREQRRIRQLLTKYPDLDKPQQSQAPAKPDGAMDYKQSLNADDETIKKLESDREQFGVNQYNAGLEQAKSIMFHTRLEVDAPRVEAKYPFLDKDSDKFKPEAAQDVNSLYLTLTGYDPKNGSVKTPEIRYGDFVDTIYTLAKDIASDEARTITKNVKSQAAKTGLRPGGNSAKPKMNLNKDPQDMTDDELKEKLKSMNIPV